MHLKSELLVMSVESKWKYRVKMKKWYIPCIAENQADCQNGGDGEIVSIWVYEKKENLVKYEKFIKFM